MVMERERTLRARIKWVTWFFVIALVLSGVTVFPLRWELDILTNLFGVSNETSATAPNEVTRWLLKVRESLNDTETKHPFLFYGTDWLGFAHIVIAVAFIGVLRDPVRNRWLFDFGLIACVLVIPFALVFGALRGIPFWWRLIDCSFGVFGFVPLWLCRKWALELESSSQ